MCTGGTPPTATMSGFRRIRQLRSWRRTSQHEVSLHGCWLSALHPTPYQSTQGSPCEGSNQANVAVSIPGTCLLHAVKHCNARLAGMHLSSSVACWPASARSVDSGPQVVDGHAGNPLLQGPARSTSGG